MGRAKIICLTPVKNESWILDRFLRCTSLWADHIIIADQGSTDNSREIVGRYPKVTLVENPSREFSEASRQQLLLEVARTIEGPRLLIALDADEMLTSNFLISNEWARVLQLTAGTVIKFQWVNVLPNMKSYWSPDIFFAWGFADDGSKFIGEKIHSVRVPVPAGAPVFQLNNIKVLHYQYTDWNRMKSKHRWYQCWERVHNPLRHTIDLYRQYHHMYAVPQAEIHPLPPEWFRGYEELGIDMTNITKEHFYWWDMEVLKFLDVYGTGMFRREAIWDIDWQAFASAYALSSADSERFADPRNVIEKLIHWRLARTQATRLRIYNRIVDALLKEIGW
jgi:glycosyltransferase involved in cell wall biosynthesis